MKEENEKEELAPDFIEGANKVDTRRPQIITAGGHVYKIMQLRKFARYRIDKLNREAWVLEQESKKPISLRKAHRISKRLNSLHAKTAAFYLLGLKALIPFVYAFTWRKLMLSHEDVICAINAAGFQGDKQINFSFTNWDFTKLQLARSMNLIGVGLKELEERMQNAKAQAEKDAATPEKEEKK